ncbi:cilium assembly protein DZIP1 isoform X2 [Rhineura floridana]|uniref:cilium assembly protein DZIP1 isoform X2 n=1 Tax=Rhineura floridana TaxID=261503 RepID=UPI002AC82223|nr:cilium assembly protein DZIP1 isoform X2 [Rhineura floridana]
MGWMDEWIMREADTFPCVFAFRQPSALIMASAASPVPAALPPFQFRPRHNSPDWRRLSAVDVERVAAELDVAVLQEHLGHVTFCNAERERCPHCQAPVDALLLKLLRLAQLCLEYLLHSQDYLSAQLRANQELLRAADAHRDLLAKDVARGAQEVLLLKEECKRRKKMISTQQMMLQAGTACHQCQFCDKAFMNYSFLHSHLQRRHALEPHIDQKQKAQTDKLQEEINKLKEQLQLTRSQLEAEQHTHVAKLSKEHEEQRSKEEEIRQLFHKWKEEEKDKLASELEKVKEMFMKEFRELTAKNTELENQHIGTILQKIMRDFTFCSGHQDTTKWQLLEVKMSSNHLKSNLGTLKDIYEFTEEKHQSAIDQQEKMQIFEKQDTEWRSKVQALKEEHENEKRQLTSQVEKYKTCSETVNANNIFYKKRIEELGQRLQEQQDLITTQKHQIEKLATKKSVESIRLSDVKASAQNVVQPKSSVSSTRETEKREPKAGKNKHHPIHSLKSNSSLTRELRVVLEQALAEKLESLGIKSGVHGIPSDHFSRVLTSVASAREERMKQIPDIQHIREQLEQQVSFRVLERASCSRLLSSLHLSPEAKQREAHLGGSLSTVLHKPAKRSSVAKRPSVQRPITSENTSTPKSKKSVLGVGIPRKPHSITTSPFSSEEEVEDDDIMQSYISPELSQPKASKSTSKGNLSRFASQSDINSMEDLEVEEFKANLKSSKSTLIQKGIVQVEKPPLSQGKEIKPAGEINVGPASIQKCAQGVKFVGVEEEEDDWDLSSLEDEKPMPAKDEKLMPAKGEKVLLGKDETVKNAAAIEKKDSNVTSMVHAWGTPMGKPTKEEGLQDADSSIKSSLATITDWSDSSDI